MRSLLQSLVWVLAWSLAAWGETAPAETPESPVRTELLHFDIYTDAQKVGQMRLKIMTVRDLVVLEEEFAAPYKNQESGFESQLVYRGTEPPVPQRAKVVTRLGGFKLMEGTVTFVQKGTGLSAKEETSGYADKERKPFLKPLTSTRETPVPGSPVLTHAAMLYFAPRLLPKEGQLEKVVYMQLPADIDFPHLIEFSSDLLLVRGPTGDDGRSEFALKRVFAGGNAVNVVTLTTDSGGNATEMRFGRFALRAAGPPAAGPARPAAK